MISNYCYVLGLFLGRQRYGMWINLNLVGILFNYSHGIVPPSIALSPYWSLKTAMESSHKITEVHIDTQRAKNA